MIIILLEKISLVCNPISYLSGFIVDCVKKSIVQKDSSCKCVLFYIVGKYFHQYFLYFLKMLLGCLSFWHCKCGTFELG